MPMMMAEPVSEAGQYESITLRVALLTSFITLGKPLFFLGFRSLMKVRNTFGLD